MEVLEDLFQPISNPAFEMIVGFFPECFMFLKHICGLGLPVEALVLGLATVKQVEVGMPATCEGGGIGTGWFSNGRNRETSVATTMNA